MSKVIVLMCPLCKRKWAQIEESTQCPYCKIGTGQDGSKLPEREKNMRITQTVYLDGGRDEWESYTNERWYRCPHGICGPNDSTFWDRAEFCELCADKDSDKDSN